MSSGVRIVVFNNRMLNEVNEFLHRAITDILIIADTQCKDVRKFLLKVTINSFFSFHV